uniref:Minor tail protein n=1 Tax=Siphoviridae sp. ctr4Z12 TaxID=2827280 RepID=A0A8S5R4Y3_9CAUD|nr:MAG TPA: minor tail protein [Siphoviridae sp. ctr4Z12]
MADGQSVGKIHLDLGINSKNFSKSMSGIEGMAKKAAKTLAATFAVKGITDFGKQCLDLGSDLTEVQNVVDSAFGPKVSKKVDSFAKDAATSFGLSETMAKRYAGTFGAMATAFGFSQDQAADMSTQLTGLAGDVASFYNISQDEAYTKLKSVFTGETESLKDLGVVMTQTALDSYAMANGFGKTTDKMTEAEKVALRYKFVQDQLSIASGDFAKTSGSWANQMRILSLQFDSLKASIGQGLINLFTPIIQKVNALMKKMVGLASIFKQFTEMLTGNKSKDDGIAATANMAADADSNMSGASSSAADLAKNTTAAGKAAKKAKKDMFGLASWDELSNNSSSKDSDSGSTSAGSGTGAVGGSNVAAGSSVLDKAGESAGKLSGILGKVKEEFVDLAKRFAAGFQLGLGNTKQVFQSIKDEIRSIGQSLIDIFTDQSVIDAVKKCAEKIATALGKIVGSIASVGLTLADLLVGSLAKYLEQHKKDLVKHLVNLFDITGQIAEIVGNFAVVVADIAAVFRSDEAKQIGANLLNIFVETKLNVLTLMAKVGRDIIDTLTAPIIENKDKIKEVLTNVIKSLSSIIGTISDVVTNTWDKIQNVYDQHIHPLFETIKEALSTWVGTILDGYNKHIVPVLDQFAKKFKDVVEKYVQPAIDAVLDAVGNLADMLSSVLNKVLKPLINWVIANIIPVLAKNFQKAGNIILAAMKGVSQIIQGVSEVFSGICKIIKGIVDGEWKTVWEGVKDIVGGVLTAIQGQFTAGWTAIKTTFRPAAVFFETIASAIKGAFQGIGEWFKNTFSGASDKLKSGFSGVKSFFSDKSKEVKDAFTGIPDWFKTKFASAYDKASGAFAKAKDNFKAIRDNIKAPFGGIADWFESTFKGAWEKVKDVFSSRGKIFAGIKEGMEKTFKTVVNGLISGINVIVLKPFDKINKMLNTIRKVGVGKIKPFEKLWEENPITVPKIPALAQGGYVKANTPQLAMIGDNRHYGEVVSPEDKLQAMAVEAGRLAAESTSAALVPVIERLCNAIITLENTSGGVELEQYKEGDLLRVVRNENSKYKKQHGVSALT